MTSLSDGVNSYCSSRSCRGSGVFRRNTGCYGRVGSVARFGANLAADVRRVICVEPFDLMELVTAGPLSPPHGLFESPNCQPALVGLFPVGVGIFGVYLSLFSASRLFVCFSSARGGRGKLLASFHPTLRTSSKGPKIMVRTASP